VVGREEPAGPETGLVVMMLVSPMNAVKIIVSGMSSHCGRFP
jgi:hypothetical protein